MCFSRLVAMFDIDKFGTLDDVIESTRPRQREVGVASSSAV